jgi:DNA-binding MarR family transcriptional regulator
MSNLADEGRLPADLVAAFTEMGPAWGRWVQACLPDDTASYARLRVLTALECDGDRTMKQLAEALEVTPRRITVLVDALEEHHLVERYAHPTDGRSTLVAITEEGLEQQRLGWQQHQDKVAVAFADLAADDQERLLPISRDLTAIFRRRLAGQSPDDDPSCAPSRGMARALTRRRKADHQA